MTADDKNTFQIARTFDAPLTLVWKAYTDIDHLSKWWGPKGFTWLKGTLDLKPGGQFHYGMRAPDGHEMWGKFVYREIVPGVRLVFTSSFSDPQGGTARASFAPNFPQRILNTASFSESGGRTTVTLRGTPFEASEDERAFFIGMFGSMQQGFNGTFDQLGEHLAALQG